MDIKVFPAKDCILSKLILPKYQGEVFLHNFPSGESYCQLKDNIRGKDVLVIFSTCFSANENIMSGLVMIDAIRRASAGRITAILPYMNYSRQDRKDKPRVPISAKLILDLLAASGANRILSVDLHAGQIQGFTNLPFDNLTAEPVLIKYLTENYNIDNLTILSPDVGAVKKASKIANLLKCNFAFITKERLSDTEVQASNIIGKITENVLIIDDITESAGTLLQAAKLCKDNGAKRVDTFVSHAALTEVGINRLKEDNNIDSFITTNTFELNEDFCKSKKCIILDISNVISEAILRINNNESVTDLFQIKGY